MKHEYKAYANREEMLKKTFTDRFLRFLVVPLLPMLGIGIIVADTNTPANVFYIWAMAIFVSYLLSVLILINGYKKYSLDFMHTSFAKNNMIAACFMSWPYLFIPFYGLYIISNKNYFKIALAILVVITCNFLLFIHSYKTMKKNFFSFYYAINENIFFDHHAYKECNEIPKSYFTICGLLLSFTAFYAISLRSSNYPSGYAISMYWACFTLSFVIYPFFIRGVYALFIHPRVEKQFNQRLLSDSWGFFELDPELATKFFSPAPLKKRPIEYEEVFPTKEKN